MGGGRAPFTMPSHGKPWLPLFPTCTDTFLFHVAWRSRAAGNSCSTSGRTNVLIQLHPQGALFQHWWFPIRGGCSWRNRHQVAVQVFSRRPPTYIPNDDVILFRPLYHMAQTGSLLPSMWIHFDFPAIADTIIAVISYS